MANAATSETYEALRNYLGTATRLVELESNRGAAGGFHAGIGVALEADAEQIVCFDDDATPEPGCISALRNAVAQLDDVGTAGPVVHDGHGRLAWPLHRPGVTVPLRTVAELEQRAAGSNVLPVEGMCWHGLLIPADVLRRVGNVDAELFHQYEDAEFALRMHAAGLRNYLVTEARCIHPPAPPALEVYIGPYPLRITRQSPSKEYLTLRNDLVVRRRYNGLRFWYGTLPLILLRGLLICLGLGLPMRVSLRRIYIRAVVDAFRGRLGPPPSDLELLSPVRTSRGYDRA